MGAVCYWQSSDSGRSSGGSLSCCAAASPNNPSRSFHIGRVVIAFVRWLWYSKRTNKLEFDEGIGMIMTTQAFSKKVTYYPSTHPGFMTISFLLISGLLAYLFRVYADDSIQPWQAYFACSLFGGGAAFYLIKWMHTAEFNNEGIVFYRLGREYRRILWSDVVQVGMAKEYKASKLTLVITPAGCPRYENHEFSTTAYVEHYRRKLILFDGTKENQAAVQLLYGELSYNAKYPNSWIK